MAQTISRNFIAAQTDSRPLAVRLAPPPPRPLIDEAPEERSTELRTGGGWRLFLAMGLLIVAWVLLLHLPNLVRAV